MTIIRSDEMSGYKLWGEQRTAPGGEANTIYSLVLTPGTPEYLGHFDRGDARAALAAFDRAVAWFATYRGGTGQ